MPGGTANLTASKSSDASGATDEWDEIQSAGDYLGAMTIVLIVVLGVLAAVVLVCGVVIGVRTALRRISAASAARVAEAFDSDAIVLQDPMANCFGLASKAGRQVRGNGALVVTADEVWFRGVGKSSPVTIARATITTVEVVMSHAGKNVGQPLLKINFDGPDGPDSIAWFVPDAASWANALKAG